MVSLPVQAALERIRPHVFRTPLIASPVLSARAGREVLLKLENLQHTGSFKLRGAASRMTALSGAERARGVVTCSSGNHGRAVAHMAAALDIRALICVPEWVDPVKLAAIQASGAEVDLQGATYDEADLRAQAIAEAEGRVLVHPFDDELVAAGQGTLALEIMQDRPDVAQVALALSGGGLVGGVAAALAQLAPQVRVTGVSAAAARVMHESLAVGHPVEMPEEETLAGALAGGIGLDNRVTFPLIRDLIRHHDLVTEDEIRAAMRFSFKDLHLIVEGGGAVALASLLAGRLEGQGPLVIVLSGGNVAPEVLIRILSE